MIYSKEEVASWSEGMKKCGVCQQLLPVDNFAKNKGSVLGRRSTCRSCRSPEYKRMYEARSFEQKMLVSAQYRASQRGLEFDITLEDIVIPEVCPILQVPIELIPGSDYAPSLDRIDPSRGYIRGNVMVTSKRGNMLKNNMTAAEARLLVSWFEQN